MKKVLILILVFLIPLINASITGKTSEQLTNMSIFVSPIIPVLNIISPENKYYQINTPILLAYNERFSKNLWYNLDNKENISVNGSFFITPDLGFHVLFLYANNSLGITSRNVSFFVASSLISEAGGSGGGGGGGASIKPKGNLSKWLNINAEIPFEIFLGDLLFIRINLDSSFANATINIRYEIKRENEIIFNEEEIIESDLTYLKNFTITESGDYTFFVKAEYGAFTAEDSGNFSVKEIEIPEQEIPKERKNYNFWILLLILMVVVVVILTILWKNRKK